MKVKTVNKVLCTKFNEFGMIVAGPACMISRFCLRTDAVLWNNAVLFMYAPSTVAIMDL